MRVLSSLSTAAQALLLFHASSSVAQTIQDGDAIIGKLN